MSSGSSSGLLGVVILARHGDREGFYQDPLTYTAALTSITPLGDVQEFQLGQQLRSLYINASSPTFINGISTGLFDQTQVQIRADAGGERGVIFDSSISVAQGLWPPTSLWNTTLADGTTVTAPLGGYQSVPIESVEPDQDVSLEGYTSCNTFNQATLNFYNSSRFLQVAQENADFLAQLPPFLDGRPVTLQNMFNIFDYMNVQSIHNKTFADALPNGFLEHVRALANFHEYGVFTSPQLDGPGNIAGRAILPSIVTGFNNIANSSNPIKFVYEAISYKPFLSLFNMTGVAQTYPQLAGVVNYAAAVVFEVRAPSSGNDPTIRMIFKNGTDDVFNTYNMFGASGDIPLSEFKTMLLPAAVNNSAQWCIACNNQQDRGCGTCNNPVLASAAAAQLQGHHHMLSLAAAGVIGAGVTTAVFLIALISMGLLGFLSFGKSSRGRKSARSSAEKLHEEDK